MKNTLDIQWRTLIRTLCLFFQWLGDFIDNNLIILKLENLDFESTAGKMLKSAQQCLEVW